MPNPVCPKGTTYIHGGIVHYKIDSVINNEKVKGLCVDEKPVSNMEYYNIYAFIRNVMDRFMAVLINRKPPNLFNTFARLGAVDPRRGGLFATDDPVVLAYARGAKEYCRLMGARLPTEGEVRHLIISGKLTFFDMKPPCEIAKPPCETGPENYSWFTQSGYRVHKSKKDGKATSIILHSERRKAHMNLASSNISFFCVTDPNS